MVASTTEAVVKAPPPRSRRGRWLAIVVRYRVLGVTMVQTLSLAEPILVMLPYRACK